MGNCSHTACVDLDTGERGAQKKQYQKEQRLFALLKQVTPETIFRDYVRRSLTRARFGQLISELKDQARDAPVSLAEAIGADAVRLLNEL
jgi:hypothetical protein